MICARCRTECSGFTGSYFDTANICFRCEEVERNHPAYEEARRVENEHVARGNFNFRGVGAPVGLVAMCVERRDAALQGPPMTQPRVGR